MERGFVLGSWILDLDGVYLFGSVFLSYMFGFLILYHPHLSYLLVFRPQLLHFVTLLSVIAMWCDVMFIVPRTTIDITI